MHIDAGGISASDAATRAAAAEAVASITAESGPHGDVARAQHLAEMAARAGVDRFALERWVERETWLGAHTAAETLERDAGLARVLHAWMHRDAQEMLDALEGVTRNPRGALDAASRTHRQVAADIGSNAVLSSLFDAMTNKRITGSAGHRQGYYDAPPGDGRPAEAFADLMSLAGSGGVGRQILERFAPEMYRVFRERLETQ